MTETEIQDKGHLFEVLLSRREGVEAALVALSKRAARKGLEAVRWSWGKAFSRKELVPHPDYGWEVEAYAVVSRIPLTIEGDAPHYEGWTFLAALQHLEGENIVRSVPGSIYDVPERFRTRGPVCDHCKLARRRNDTYVLRHEDGRIVQVGSTCIGDFLGSADASKIAAAASILAEARGLAEGGCSGAGGGGDRTLAEYLPFVARMIREEGWVSRTVAREENREESATASRAFRFMTDDGAKTPLSDDDVAEAAAAEAWAEALTDTEVDAGKGDYLHNLRAVARTGLVTRRTAGIAGSMIVAHQRVVARERERAERVARLKMDAYVGTVGKRETFDVVLDFVGGYETQYGYVTLLKFRTSGEGACVVWKATNTDLGRADVGKRYQLSGSVKEHSEYRGEKQTVLTRCRVEVK